MSSLRSYFIAVLFVTLSLLSGCAIFRPVGNAVSDGYDNTVAYFNSYYNASRLFHEAEDEILEAEKKRRALEGFSDRRVTPSGAPMTKLTAVIDKCSNILAFQPESALVDDALFLIGKSFFYQTEFLKSERKFSELLAFASDGPLAMEASLWRVKTLLELKNEEEGLPETRAFIQKALDSGEEETAGEASLILGHFSARRGDSQEALTAYQEAVRLSGDEMIRARAQFSIGNVRMELGEFSDAADAYLQAGEYSDEPGLYIASHQMAIKAMREAGEFDKALEISHNLAEDYRFVSHEKAIVFEEAVTLHAKGDRGEAVNLFTMVDTTGTKTELGAKAAFELGRIHEESGEYEKALAAYMRATGFPVPSIFATARQKSGAFTRYLALKSQRAKWDSLLWSLDSAQADTIRPTLNRDSLHTLQAVNAYDLGEVFYSELEKPDSAEVWYRMALGNINDSTRAPRILFILAELLKDGPERLYEEIIKSYPRSHYAVRAKMKLGIQGESVVDSAAFVYRKAEESLESGEFRKAVGELKDIARVYPESPFAAKSAYALGWIYEHKLHHPDTALTFYRSLVEHFGNSDYARVVRRRLQLGTASADSVAGAREKLKENDERRMDQKLPEKPSRDKKVIIE
ncbi:MAG: tetratricopeptide repeat protein [Bacteroidota bacterium]